MSKPRAAQIITAMVLLAALAAVAWWRGAAPPDPRQAIYEMLETTRAGDNTMKGVALSEPEPQPDGGVMIRVEYVYADRNEAQRFYLEKAGTRWKITRADPAERIKTLVPYGTPVK